MDTLLIAKLFHSINRTLAPKGDEQRGSNVTYRHDGTKVTHVSSFEELQSVLKGIR